MSWLGKLMVTKINRLSHSEKCLKNKLMNNIETLRKNLIDIEYDTDKYPFKLAIESLDRIKYTRNILGNLTYLAEKDQLPLHIKYFMQT